MTSDLYSLDDMDLAEAVFYANLERDSQFINQVKHRPQQVWQRYEAADRLILAAAMIGVDPRKVLRAACDCARTSLQYVPADDDRAAAAIEAAERWCDGAIDAADIIAVVDAAREAQWAYDYRSSRGKKYNPNTCGTKYLPAYYEDQAAVYAMLAARMCAMAALGIAHIASDYAAPDGGLIAGAPDSAVAIYRAYHGVNRDSCSLASEAFGAETAAWFANQAALYAISGVHAGRSKFTVGAQALCDFFRNPLGRHAPAADLWYPKPRPDAEEITHCAKIVRARITADDIAGALGQPPASRGPRP